MTNTHATEPMTPRERVIATFERKPVDQRPWFADLSWWQRAEEHSGRVSEKYSGEEGLAGLHQDLNCGFYLQPVDFFQLEFETPVELKRENNLWIRTIKTPVGSLQEIQEYLPDAATWAPREHWVKEAADLRPFRYWLEGIHPVADYSGLERRIRLCGPNGIAIMTLPRTPLSRMLVEVSGIEFLAFALADDPGQVEKTFKTFEKIDDPFYKIAEEAPALFAMFPDNLSSDILSPRWFEKYSLPYYQQRTEQLRRAGKWTFTHLDGVMRGLLPLLGRSGVSCVEALTPAPYGDLQPEQIRELAGDEVVLWGGLPGPLFSPSCSDENFQRAVLHCLEVFQDDPAFVLGVGDQVPPDGIIERVRRVSELIKQSRS